MCRYAMTAYKPHYACFECRKTFKRKLFSDIRKGEQTFEAKCPQCGALMANMGLDFEAPKKDDVKKWEHLKNLYQVGITFHSCGCSGPGYIPRDKEQLKKYFEDILEKYHQNLNAFRERIEPENKKEADRDRSKNWYLLSGLPNNIKDKKGGVKNEDAKKFWLEKIKEIEEKLNVIRTQ